MRNVTETLFIVGTCGAFTVLAIVQAPTGQQITDAMYAAFGDNHSRAVHAKGTMVEGTFTPDPAARSLSKAKLFTLSTAKVLGRFSDFTGIPTIPDNIEGASPRGMAVKFSVPGESEVDVVMHNFNGFPTRTSAEFRELLLAVGASGKNAPKPTPLDTFLASHPIAKTFLTTQKSPESFATSAFFGVNSIKFTNAQGQPTLRAVSSFRRPASIISKPLHSKPRTPTTFRARSARGSPRSPSASPGMPRSPTKVTSSTIRPLRGRPRASWSSWVL
jgi:hypothetical protein